MLGLQANYDRTAAYALVGPQRGLKGVRRVTARRQGEVSRPAKGPEIGETEQFPGRHGGSRSDGIEN